MSDFAATVREFAVKAKENLDKDVRGITLALFSSVINLSPVGRPELWAANAENVRVRASYMDMAEALNADGSGKRKISTSNRALDKKFGKMKAPKGYVGGRFRGNWQTSVGEPITATIERIDPSGAASTADVIAHMGGAGKVTYMTNNLPYAERLEYEGWSKQAPAGMVRVSMARIDSIVSELK